MNIEHANFIRIFMYFCSQVNICIKYEEVEKLISKTEKTHILPPRTKTHTENAVYSNVKWCKLFSPLLNIFQSRTSIIYQYETRRKKILLLFSSLFWQTCLFLIYANDIHVFQHQTTNSLSHFAPGICNIVLKWCRKHRYFSVKFIRIFTIFI